MENTKEPQQPEINMARYFYRHRRRRSRLLRFSNSLGTLSSVALVYIYVMKQLQPYARHCLRYLRIEPMRPLPIGVVALFAIIHIFSLFFMLTRDHLSPRNYVLASIGVLIAQMTTMAVYLSLMMY